MADLCDGGGICHVQNAQSARSIRNVSKTSGHCHGVRCTGSVVAAQDDWLGRVCDADDLQSTFTIGEINHSTDQIKVVGRAWSIGLTDW